MTRICFFIALLWATTVNAQFNFSGTVQGETPLLDGATVSIKGSETRQAFTINGAFNFQNLPKGNYQLHVSYIGHYSFDTTISLPSKAIIISLNALANNLQPVEVRSLRAAEGAPFTKTNLSKSVIEKANLGYDIPLLLNQLPNVVVNSDAGNGVGYTGIRIRGSDASRINVTLNGVPYNDAESQGTFFVNMPDLLSSATSIQVQRGVGTSSNGPGAFGGGISISTNDYNTQTYTELNNSIGSFNTFKNTLKFGSGLIDNKFTIDARISHISSDGFMDRASSKLIGGYFNAGYFTKNSALRFIVLLGKEKTYQAWYGIPEASLTSNRTQNTAGTEKSGTPYDNETDNYWQNHFQLIYTKTFKNKLLLNNTFYLSKGKGYYEQYKADQTLSNYGLAPILVNGNPITNTDLIRRLWLNNTLFGQTASLQKQKGSSAFTLGGNWSVYPGNHYGDIIWTAAKPDLNHRWYDLDARKIDISSFIKWQYTINPNWKFFTDLQYRFVNYKLIGFRNNPSISLDNQYNFINPKVGISYIKNNWSGYLSYALANKEPNRDDFEAGLTQQPKREQLHDVELNLQNKSIVKGLSAGLTLYGMFYKDQLILTGRINDVGAYTRTNQPYSYRVGAELETRYQFAKGAINYSLALSRNRIKNFTEYLDDYDNGGQVSINHGTTPISFSPTAIQYLSVGYQPFTNFTTEWMSKYVSAQFLDNSGLANRTLDAFWVNDLRASYRIPFKKTIKEANLIFQVNNVFNSRYEPNGYSFSYYAGARLNTENFYYPMAGRNLMLAVNLKF